MPLRWYLADLTAHPTRPTMTISRCELYPRATASNVVANPQKTWCLTLVDATTEEHAVIAADAAIRPIGGDLVLDMLYADVPSGTQTQIETFVEGLRVPLGWVDATTTVRDVLRMVVRVLLLVQQLKADFPEADLDTTFGTIGAGQRNRILNWCSNNNVSTTGLTTGTTIRAMLRALVTRYPWPPTHTFGSVTL